MLIFFSQACFIWPDPNNVVTILYCQESCVKMGTVSSYQGVIYVISPDSVDPCALLNTCATLDIKSWQLEL